MSIIPYTNGNIPLYRFWIFEAPTSFSYEVFPLNFLSTSLVDEIEKERAFYRRKFNGKLLFGTNDKVIDYDDGVTVHNRMDDFDLLWAQEQHDPCSKIYLHIHKIVEGAITQYWDGYFSTTDGYFDLDKCTFEVTPLANDDYVDLLDCADTQYNILHLTTIVSTHAYLAGFIDVNYTRNRWIARPGVAPVLANNNVIWYIADQMLAGIIVSSHFFTDTPNNYVTKAANHLLYLTIAQKSDIIRPTATNQATTALLSWNELMNILWTMFQVRWNFNGVNTINVEHESWFLHAGTWDIRNQLATVATNKYSYLKEKMPKYERFAFMEADNPDFIGVPIYYDSACVDQDPDTNNKELSINVTTDLEYIYKNSTPIETNAISDDGFVILCNDATNHVEVEGGAYIGYWKLNMHLSWANLHHRYFRYNRILIHGYMNEVDTPFWTALKTKKQDCSAIICSDYDPNDAIITELGMIHFGGVYGEVQRSELSPTGRIKLALLYGPADNDAAIAIGVPDFAGGPPADPVATAAESEGDTEFEAHWLPSVGASGYFLDVSIDPAFGSFITYWHDYDVAGGDDDGGGDRYWKVDNGLTTGTNYHYRLRAYGEGGISGYSNIIDVTTT